MQAIKIIIIVLYVLILSFWIPAFYSVNEIEFNFVNLSTLIGIEIIIIIHAGERADNFNKWFNSKLK